MCKLGIIAASVLCGAAVVLASCGTTNSIRASATDTAVVTPAIAAAETARPTQITVGTLTDPCGLGLDDPWWLDHGGRVEFHRRCG